MSPRRITRKTDASIQSEEGRDEDGKNVSAPQEARSRCILCREPVHHRTMRTVTSGDRQFPVHAACLDRLHSLLRDAFDTPPPTPTLTRSLSLGEFLLSKRPRKDAEILACIAYYHQIQTTQSSTFTAAALEQRLRYTGFKIKDLEAALRDATDQLAYLEVFTENGAIRHRLTAKGMYLVKHLPTTDD